MPSHSTLRSQGGYRALGSTTAAPPAAPDRARISDAVVAKALRAYESLPEHSGREERMREAIAAVTRPRARDESAA